MFGLFLASVVAFFSLLFSRGGFAGALASAGSFLFFWTAFWSLLFASFAGLLLFVGGAVLLRLPPQVRNLAAPLALTGGFKTLISKPVLSWVASVALILAGTHTLQLQSGGVDPLLGAWLVALGFLLKRSAWGALKSKANFKVFRPGEFPGAGPVPGFEGGFDRSMDQDRFAQARDVVVEPVAQVGRSESKGRISH